MKEITSHKLTSSKHLAIIVHIAYHMTLFRMILVEETRLSKRPTPLTEDMTAHVCPKQSMLLVFGFKSLAFYSLIYPQAFEPRGSALIVVKITLATLVVCIFFG